MQITKRSFFIDFLGIYCIPSIDTLCCSVLSLSRKCCEFQLYKTVVSFGKLLGKHFLIFRSYGIKVIIPLWNFNRFFCFSAASLIDKGKLHIHRGIKVIKKVAPVFKDCGFLICFCKLIVDVGKGNAPTVSVFCYFIDFVWIYGKVGDALLCGRSLFIRVCFSNQLRNLLFLASCQLSFRRRLWREGSIPR